MQDARQSEKNKIRYSVYFLVSELPQTDLRLSLYGPWLIVLINNLLGFARKTMEVAIKLVW